MCTVTLTYDSNNALARRKLSDLLSTGLFMKKKTTRKKANSIAVAEHRKEVEAFMDASKKSMSTIIERYL